MADIKFWGSTTGSNSLSATDGYFPEGMRPSLINDSARLTMAAVRKQFQDYEWFDYGYTPSFATTASFTLAGDKRTIYQARRRVKFYDANTLYGEVTDSTFSSNTRVSVTLDSGQLAASLSAVSVGFLIPGGATPFNTATAVNSCSSASRIYGGYLADYMTGSASANQSYITLTSSLAVSNKYIMSAWTGSSPLIFKNQEASFSPTGPLVIFGLQTFAGQPDRIFISRYNGATDIVHYVIKKWINS